jgi:uncharacterized protein (DUF4415 family)
MNPNATTLSPFEQGLLESIAQAQRGEFAVVHTQQAIQARRVGRPSGSVKATSKVPVKIRLDHDLVTALRASGRGWQTRVNEALRHVARSEMHLDVA